MAKASHKLELGDGKKNIFVTQLQDRDYEDEEVNAFPIVKESAGKLIETGINTLQKTLLLKKEVEVDKVHHELQQKREEFKRRMEACAEKRILVQKKQQEMKEKVASCEKFIKDQEAKRRRAIVKYQTEVKLREQKTNELEEMLKNLEDLKKRHRYLERKIASYKRYEHYLLRVVDAMPENYIEMQDNMLNSLMMRHHTLSETNKDLVDNVLGMADELEALKAELDQMNQDHDQRNYSINRDLATMQKLQEERTDANQEMEAMYIAGKNLFRALQTEYGMVMMAIDNICTKCTKFGDTPTDLLTLEEKLERIKEHLEERTSVAKLAGPDGDGEERTKSGRSRYSRASYAKKKPTTVKFADQ